jgi:peroxisomal 3,2-trans-enoyl-CoA isomerase
MFGSYTFPRHFGYMKSYELFILGKRLSAEEALNSRFVSNIFEDKELMINYALTLCKEIETMN